MKGQTKGTGFDFGLVREHLTNPAIEIGPGRKLMAPGAIRFQVLQIDWDILGRLANADVEDVGRDHLKRRLQS
jgi:hypothetical protein